ncbi:MAG: hypothetical protein R3C28_06010 [Pirellulaceae bacterium]
MIEQQEDENQLQGKLVCWLIVALALVNLVAHIAAVRSGNGRLPFFCANDRSRWCTISSLVDHDSYAIDKVIKRRGWDSIDKVRHKGTDGKWHYYSSKPTLLTTMCAVPYGLMNRVFDIEIEDAPFTVVRTSLLLINVLPLLLYFWLLLHLSQELCETAWARVFVVTAATWGTFLTPFSVSLNNHVPAAISVLLTVYAVLKVWNEETPKWRYFVIAGFGRCVCCCQRIAGVIVLRFYRGGIALEVSSAHFDRLRTISGNHLRRILWHQLCCSSRPASAIHASRSGRRLVRLSRQLLDWRKTRRGQRRTVDPQVRVSRFTGPLRRVLIDTDFLVQPSRCCVLAAE